MKILSLILISSLSLLRSIVVSSFLSRQNIHVLSIYDRTNKEIKIRNWSRSRHWKPDVSGEGKILLFFRFLEFGQRKTTCLQNERPTFPNKNKKKKTQKNYILVIFLTRNRIIPCLLSFYLTPPHLLAPFSSQQKPVE